MAIACLGAAAFLALDWADYGADSTCGNLVRYKGAGGTCAHLIRGRAFGVAALTLIAIVVVAIGWSVRGDARSGTPVGES